MKLEKTVKLFKGFEHVFQCPFCNGSLSLNENASFLCEKQHCFDVSSKGYINFIPNQKLLKYKKELFESRQNIFSNGFYKNILSEIILLIEKYNTKQQRYQILDIGCGEGYYSYELSKAINDADLFAMDIVKDAIILAAKKHAPIRYMVANLSNIPLKDKQMDVILNILTPANYNEFLRILSDDGILIKIIPGENYLKEIRALAAKQLKNKTYTNQPITDYFEGHIRLMERRSIQYQLPLTLDQASDFVQMTPLMFDIDTSTLDISSLQSITIHLELLVGKKESVAEHCSTT